MGALYYGRYIFSSYDFHLVAMETKQTNLWRQVKDQAQSQPRTLGKWQTGCDIIKHSFTQSAFFRAVDTVIGKRMELNFEVVTNSVRVRPKTQYLSWIS